MSLLHIAVLVPARNEEDLLPRCLRSITAACEALPESIATDIIVAVDSSQDQTFTFAERLLLGRGHVVRTEAACVGSARYRAAEIAISRYRGPTEDLWLANTDADCCVPQDWLVDQLCLAESGIDAIAGIVDVDCFAGHQDGVEKRFRESYRLNADGTHSHVHGANLGVRADAYLKAGGWNALSTAEDHDLWQRLHNAGAKRASISAISVVTSGRRVGRAPRGFAGALAAHNLAGSVKERVL